MTLNTVYTKATQQVATPGNVGVGTTVAGAILDVLANSSTTALRVNQKGAGNILDIQDNGSTRMFVNTTGNVGIGTTTLKRTLDVVGDINFTGSLYLNNVAYTGGSQWTTSGSAIYYASGNVGVGTTLANALLNVGKGTTTVAPILLTSGTNLTTPVIGALEFDGNALYSTTNTTSGRAEIPVYYGYVLTSDRSAIGSAIADYFPASSSINLEAASYYELDVMCYFTKTTLGTVTWTWLFSSAASMARSYYVGTAAGGFSATANTGAPISGTAAQLTSTTLTHASTTSLTTGVSHQFIFKVHVVTNLATNVRLRVTNSAGTVTPKAGSYYKVKKILVNTGVFSA